MTPSILRSINDLPRSRRYRANCERRRARRMKRVFREDRKISARARNVNFPFRLIPVRFPYFALTPSPPSVLCFRRREFTHAGIITCARMRNSRATFGRAPCVTRSNPVKSYCAAEPFTVNSRNVSRGLHRMPRRRWSHGDVGVSHPLAPSRYLLSARQKEAARARALQINNTLGIRVTLYPANFM